MSEYALYTSEEKSIAELIEMADWEGALEFCKRYPDRMSEREPTTGATVLHRLCNKPPAPIYLFEAVLDAHPEAVRIQESKYMATPLHVLSWTSQRSTRKVKLVLKYMSPQDMELRNRFGGTVLHSSCGSQSSLDALKLIVAKNPAIIPAVTHEYNHTALTALWHSHLQSIPGQIQIGKILKGREVDDDAHFDRFWEKLTFLACQAYHYSSEYDSEKGGRATANGTATKFGEEESFYALHGLFLLRAPIKAIQVAIRRHPEWSQVADPNGNYPLHVVVLRRPFRVKDIDIIDMLLEAFPDAAGFKNKNGDTPLVLAIRDRMVWEEGMKSLVHANTDVLSALDPQTGLYPFLQAAALDGRVAVNTTYQLLCRRPDLVKGATLAKRRVICPEGQLRISGGLAQALHQKQGVASEHMAPNCRQNN